MIAVYPTNGTVNSPNFLLLLHKHVPLTPAPDTPPDASTLPLRPTSYCRRPTPSSSRSPPKGSLSAVASTALAPGRSVRGTCPPPPAWSRTTSRSVSKLCTASWASPSLSSAFSAAYHPDIQRIWRFVAAIFWESARAKARRSGPAGSRRSLSSDTNQIRIRASHPAKNSTGSAVAISAGRLRSLFSFA